MMCVYTLLLLYFSSSEGVSGVEEANGTSENLSTKILSTFRIVAPPSESVNTVGGTYLRFVK